MNSSDESEGIGLEGLTYRMSPSESSSEAVLHATAEATGSKVIGSTPEEENVLDPLYHAIDPEALDNLFHSITGDGHRSDGKITFTYCGCKVEVENRGVVKVQNRNIVEEEKNGDV
ncbi:HalOD1 output domain-containing protein [Natrinema halophilum]|uniref:Halobacterial output domain-containing protein n=1 Tax=Natrinema halophilum TaxID=1699371 RepID=A0A7D5GQL2_9EURY|nr:HalOD1 output domain-containing protein [Natrinema halophilum]QLG47829.1 hypothetical protein HYG82_02695 [Natrinema halophilum]